MAAVDSQDWTVEGARAHIAARLDAPHTGARAQALFAHCFPGNETAGPAEHIAHSLAARGIGVLRMELAGAAGPSETGSPPPADVEDLVRAADQLRRDGRPPVLLIGHALGGAATLAAAQRIPEVRAIVSIGAPLSPRAVGGGATTGAAPLLIVQIPDDETAESHRAHPIAGAAPASVITLAGADQQLRRPEDARWVADLIDSWATRFLSGPGPSDREVRAEPGTVVVSSGGQGRYAQNVDTDRHRWRADEPESVGGAGSGPDPYQLLLSALGACTAITLRMYADRAGIPLDDATITLTHDRLHATDCAECATESGHVDRIVREIHLDGALTDVQRSRLLEIADRCPVERTLRSEIIIETDEV